MPDDTVAPGAATAAPGGEALPAAGPGLAPGAGSGAAEGAAAVQPQAAAAPAADVAAVATAPAADAAKAGADAAKPALDAAKPAADATKPPADGKAAAKPEFAPSLLDAAAADKAAGDKAGDKKPAADAKAADAKPGDAKAAPGKDGAPGDAPPAPIEYAFTYPEGVDPASVNAERMGQFTGVLNEGRLKPELGQKLLDMHLSEVSEVAKKLAQNQWDVFNGQQNRWRDEVMADPELGGSRHQTAIKEIMSVVDSYAGSAEERKGLLDAFRTTGIANNPHFLRFLQRAGADLAREATPHPAPPPRAPAPTGTQRGLNRYAKTTAVNGGR